MPSVETERVRVIWKARPNFNGAAWPFAAVYTQGVSSPVLRFMVAPRVKALRHAYALACAECGTEEDPDKGPAEQAHAAGCSKAPPAPLETAAQQAPAPPPALLDTAPEAPALPRKEVPPALLAEPIPAAPEAPSAPRQVTPPAPVTFRADVRGEYANTAPRPAQKGRRA